MTGRHRRNRKQRFFYVIETYDAPTLFWEGWSQPSQTVNFDELSAELQQRPFQTIRRAAWQGVKFTHDILAINNSDHLRRYVETVSDGGPSFTRDPNEALPFETLLSAEEHAQSLGKEFKVRQIKI